MNTSSVCLVLSILLVGAMTQSSPQLQAFLDGHNLKRTQLKAGSVRGQPKAKAMAFLKWDNGLQATAQRTANTCIFDHDSDQDRIPAGQANNPLYGWVGQNIAMMASSTAKFDVTQSMDMWWNENRDYRYTTNTCANGKVCGHYTQMAWASTTRLGCGYRMCAENDEITMPWVMIVCNYATGGNMDGEKPYPA
ncbi:hypothetical protein Ciccas_006382 [Cichlidogyrus casuarinus]|uniref:SCP domain-containing protein n=1 Tax=Cichlidogyrus casuarinus TaxID=1844966 RepID=A0ABD2Q5X9_9PLAT